MARIAREDRTHESLAQQMDIIEAGTPGSTLEYTTNYIDAMFTKWYSAGKPTARRLVGMAPNPADFGISAPPPSERTLVNWIRDKFKERAAMLDAEVSNVMAQQLVADKVEMLKKHVELADKMQEMALTYLDEHKDKLNSNSAVRLLVEGVRIERESRGIPRTLEKLANKSDEELLRDVIEMIGRSEVRFLPDEDEFSPPSEEELEG